MGSAGTSRPSEPARGTARVIEAPEPATVEQPEAGVDGNKAEALGLGHCEARRASGDGDRHRAGLIIAHGRISVYREHRRKREMEPGIRAIV
jgi:hypothetical protein